LGERSAGLSAVWIRNDVTIRCDYMRIVALFVGV